MPREKFESLAAEGFEQLPQWVREKIKNVALLVEDEPSEEVRKTEGLGEDETLLGYYQGVPLSERGDLYGVGMTMPDTITLYQYPIEEAALEILPEDKLDDEHAFAEAVKKEVTDTIWHEFFHHFGANEHEVRLEEKRRGKGNSRDGHA